MFNKAEIEYLKGFLPFLKTLDEADLRSIMTAGSKSTFKSGDIYTQ